MLERWSMCLVLHHFIRRTRWLHHLLALCQGASISGTHKFDWCLSRLLHTELHWLDVSERVMYKLDVMVFKCLCTSWNCANQSQVSHHDNISDPPPDSSWSYRATDSAFVADGLSVWLARRSGIPCQTACRIRLLAGTVSDNLWRCFCLQRTVAFSALEVYDDVLYKLTLFTYLHRCLYAVVSVC